MRVGPICDDFFGQKETVTPETKERIKWWYTDACRKTIFDLPFCPNCGAILARWGWYEAPNEPIEYWYCLDCDVAGRSPYIFVLPARDKSEKLHQNVTIAQKGE